MNLICCITSLSKHFRMEDFKCNCVVVTELLWDGGFFEAQGNKSLVLKMSVRTPLSFDKSFSTRPGMLSALKACKEVVEVV